MVRVGVQADVPEGLLEFFPKDGVELVRIPKGLQEKVEVEFWVLPFNRPEAEAQMPFVEGVKVMQSGLAGIDWVLPWKREGVTLCDGRGIHDVSTSEWVLTAILASLKWLPVYGKAQAEAKWVGDWKMRSPFLSEETHTRGRYRVLNEELWSKTVLIVGYGSIGAATERRLKAFDAKVIRVARSARTEQEVHAFTELDDLLPQADVVVLLLPLTAETTGMFGRERLEKLKFGALLVNAARGPIVVTEDLMAVLAEGKIRAALDVTDPEPLPEGHPLWSAPNCLITPHIAGLTPNFMERAYALIGKNIERYLKGEPLENTVGEAGY
ncbi:2-hydroxyacid dehydrogenase [Terriglobus tenax]|uniref:2-hydroxyacid dehydrogenase n=1 Tax=Terriglobus tenax TaxID=1111115 RepID=UPI0021DFC6F6|nr:2-hydroxyacid dehydrogenase [Terriglobus tenax]